MRVTTGASTPRAISIAPTSQGMPASAANTRLPQPKSRAGAADATEVVTEEGSIVEANLVHQFTGFAAMFGDFRQRQSVDRQFTEAGHDGVEFHAGFHGVFVIGPGVETLCLVGHEILQQL